MSRWLARFREMHSDDHARSETPVSPRNSPAAEEMRGNAGISTPERNPSSASVPSPEIPRFPPKRYSGELEHSGGSVAASETPVDHQDQVEANRLLAAAERALTGVVGVSDEGEFLRERDEP